MGGLEMIVRSFWMRGFEMEWLGNPLSVNRFNNRSKQVLFMSVLFNTQDSDVPIKLFTDRALG
ncbi:hypothetical protein GCM10027347_29550 [Larkinella harenae]